MSAQVKRYIYYRIPNVSWTTAGHIAVSVLQLVCSAGLTLTSINHTCQNNKMNDKKGVIYHS